MGFNEIPVDGLTHAYFAFGYIIPITPKVAPMDDLPADLFSQFTAIKRRNSGLKTVIALGGDMVSTAENRKLFVGNLLGFMRRYGFDGVDFGWEYPGAGDCGRRPDDGKNFVAFLKELDEVNNLQPSKYVVSFTIPTSYWCSTISPRMRRSRVSRRIGYLGSWKGRIDRDDASRSSAV
ncbi:glycoside hydrolase superfamily [Microdochium trichocladiopsis]|uniref:chitinase n=1 Tax=Microdochium trichocladiopsis TaxID=1682393 RepID=A0A9P8XZJ9_9PEZI|nr:glycoside hydrolase superfamily [Microdochium trichocladiopsis]KAH7024945.1 glycoside hydrolase superfamily [Microdochium trichocladiopsis]